MNELGIEITLDEYVVEVGERITGRLVRWPDTDGVTEKSKVRKIELSLRYKTVGRGDTNTAAVSTQEFPCDQHGAVNAVISLNVPNGGPISYDGRLIRVQWALEARLDIKLARDPKQHVDLLIVPRNGFTVYDRPHPLAP